MMTVEELRRALKDAGIFQRISHESEGRSLEQLLADYADLSVSEFCSRAREGLKKKPKAKEAASSRAILNASAVGSYLMELGKTKTDSHQFERVVARMKADKGMRIDEAREVAMRFIGGTRTYKTKADAFRAILQRQIADIRATEKLGRIADIF